jgi:putative ABC transport system permease protein
VNRFFAGLVGAFVEAWTELRIHRTRVLLSLIGVAVAVAAITSVVGAGAIAEQAQREQAEAQGGRPALLAISAYSETGTIEPADFDEAFRTAIDRYSITYTSRNGYGNRGVQFADGVTDVQIITADRAFGTMHRTKVAEGSWFTEFDENRLAPAVIINNETWKRLGYPDLASHPTLEFVGDQPLIAVIVGVMPAQQYEQDYYEVRMLTSAWERIVTPEELEMSPPSYEAWVPPEMAEELTSLIQRDIAGALGEGVIVDVYRNDYEANLGGEDPFLSIKLVIGGVAALVLFLGALSLVNISLVTVRQRIREIGIRRSFGATAGRVFFAVMMESLVGTVVAGFVGVIVAIIVVSSDFVRSNIGQGVQDLPALPIEAAAIGMIAATAVGALAGLLPALVAVRVKVIDAIRY